MPNILKLLGLAAGFQLLDYFHGIFEAVSELLRYSLNVFDQ